MNFWKEVCFYLFWIKNSYSENKWKVQYEYLIALGKYAKSIHSIYS